MRGENIGAQRPSAKTPMLKKPNEGIQPPK